MRWRAQCVYPNGYVEYAFRYESQESALAHALDGLATRPRGTRVRIWKDAA